MSHQSGPAAASPLPAVAAVALAAPAPQAGAANRVRRIASRDLLGEAAEIEIDHDGQLYRLRRTSLGKLILTK